MGVFSWGGKPTGKLQTNRQTSKQIHTHTHLESDSQVDWKQCFLSRLQRAVPSTPHCCFLWHPQKSESWPNERIRIPFPSVSITLQFSLCWRHNTDEKINAAQKPDLIYANDSYRLPLLPVTRVHQCLVEAETGSSLSIYYSGCATCVHLDFEMASGNRICLWPFWTQLSSN